MCIDTKKKPDMEIAGFLASCLAYGQVRQIEKNVEYLLSIMSPSPRRFIENYNDSQKHLFNNFNYRFTKPKDITDLLATLKLVLTDFGSLENFFARYYKTTDDNVLPAVITAVDHLLMTHKTLNQGRINKGLAYLLPNPRNNSPCKRLNLFLKWMIRSDDVDPGLWTSIPPSKLIIPVDIHMARLCKILNLYSRKTVTLKTALEITRSFAKIEPADPAKYDFALSRIGIVENCTGKPNEYCKDCELLEFCIKKEGFKNES